VSWHDSRRDSPSRPPLKGRSARATEDVDVKRSRGDGCELERSAASGDERNRPWRRPCGDSGNPTTARRQRLWTSSGVGAMDVSWSEAQRAETNVIARSDDRATIYGGKVQ
jgi:hypothetical protein